MKRIISAIAILTLLLTLSACNLQGKTKLTMAVLSDDVQYSAYSEKLIQTAETVSSVQLETASVKSLRDMVCDIELGKYQMGILPSDMLSYAWDGIRSFEKEGAIVAIRPVAALGAEVLQIITTNADVQTVSDLKGKNVSVGAVGSAVYYRAQDVLTAAGIAEQDLSKQNLSVADSIKALKNGEIDAAFMNFESSQTEISDLFSGHNAALVPIDAEIIAKIMETSSCYIASEISSGSYSGQSEAVETLAVPTVLVANADVDANAIYAMTKAICEEPTFMANAVVQKGITVPFHTGAEAWFAENSVE